MKYSKRFRNNGFCIAVIMAVGGKPPSKIFPKAAFGLILSIKVPAYFLGKLKDIPFGIPKWSK